MNKLGVSLPWDYLSGSIITKEASVIEKNIGKCKTFLDILKAEGISSIELRHRHRDLDRDDMYRAIETVKISGLSVTIHGDALPKPEQFNFDNLFPWHGIVGEFFKGSESSIVITFHPIIAENNIDLSADLTASTLKVLSESSNTKKGFTYVLENQRSKGYIDPGITFDGVVDMVKKIPDKKIGICWDMGHSYSNVVNYNHPLFPPKEFLERVKHTHIHDLGPTGRTHWPFKQNEVPLEENIELLKEYGYKGIYNLELSFDRFAGEPDIRKLVTGSIKLLRKYVQ